MKRIQILALLLCCTLYVQAQQSPLSLAFLRNVGGPSDEQVTDVAIDQNGDIIVVGTFKNTVTFNSGGTISLTSYMQSATSYSADVFIAKYSSTGIFQWVNTYGGNSADNAVGVQVDDANNIYVLGSFYDSVDYSNAPGWQTMVAQPGLADLIFAKYSSSGNLVWAKQLGGPSSDAAVDIAIDDLNNIYLTGTFFGTADYDPGPGFDTLTYTTAGPCSFQTPCTPDVFIAKYDTSGNHIWARQAGSINNDNPKNIVCDAHGNIYLSGIFVFNITFGMGSANADTLTSVGTNDAFVAKYLPNGDFAWAKQLGGTASMNINDLQFDHQGNFVITGGFQGDTDFDWGPDTTSLFSTVGTNNIYFAKYDSSANFVFAKNMEHLNAPGQDYGNAVAFDALDNIFVTGKFYGQNCDFDPSAATAFLSSASSNNNELFLGKYTPTGNYIWADRVGDAGSDEGISLATDNFSSVVMVSNTSSAGIDYDFSSSTSSYTSVGGSDVVITKYTQCIVNTASSLANAVITVQATGANYQWINCGVGNAPISGANSQSFTPTTTGTYACIITNSASCKDTTTCTYVDVCAAFSAGVTSSNPGVITCSVSNASSYQWLQCTNNGTSFTVIPNATSQSFTPTANGSYACKVNKGGCVDTTTCFTINDVGMLEVDILQVTVYPNPAHDVLQLSSIKNIQNIVVFDLAGHQLMMQRNIHDKNIALNISSLSAGMYLLRADDGQGHFSNYQFIKQE